MTCSRWRITRGEHNSFHAPRRNKARERNSLLVGKQKAGYAAEWNRRVGWSAELARGCALLVCPSEAEKSRDADPSCGKHGRGSVYPAVTHCSWWRGGMLRRTQLSNRAQKGVCFRGNVASVVAFYRFLFISLIFIAFFIIPSPLSSLGGLLYASLLFSGPCFSDP